MKRGFLLRRINRFPGEYLEVQRVQDIIQKPVKAVLFDMDNTLFDLVGAQITACQEVTRSLGIPEENLLFPYFLRPLHGFESHENILDFMLDHRIPVPGSYDRARRIYEEEKIRHITPYPGVVETLVRIRDQGFPMGIVTDAHSRDAVMRLEKAGLLPFFCCMVTYDLVRVKKPAPDPFITALDMLQSMADEVLLVGDSPRRDIEPGRTLGIRTVYARYGDRFSDDRSSVQADYTIDTLAELPEILSRLSGTNV
ncbi:MAG: HAD family hydrolase [Methanoregulaceae archaeon]|nr:MAG: HAD family hydrolase [Methanoregulaceae archaeon]